MGTELTLSTSYQPQTNAQIEIVKKWIEGYLRNYVRVSKNHGSDGCTLGSIVTIPLSIYPLGKHIAKHHGYDASSLINKIFGDSKAPIAKDWIQESQYILKILKENMQVAQNWAKDIRRPTSNRTQF